MIYLFIFTKISSILHSATLQTD